MWYATYIVRDVRAEVKDEYLRPSEASWEIV